MNIPYLIIRCIAQYVFVIKYDAYEGIYMNMSERKALEQFRADFGLKGKRLERL